MNHRWIAGLGFCGLLLLSSGEVTAKPVPLQANVGIAPAVHFVTGPVQGQQLLHSGIKLRVQGVIDGETIEKHKNRVPKKFRKHLKNVEEIRVSPFWYLPDTLFISPKVDSSQMYGVAFKPLGLGTSIGTVPRLGVGAGLLFTYVFQQADGLNGGEATHFIRPGLDLTLDLEIPFSREFLLSLGWSSQVYIPQEIGGFGMGEAPLENSIWHIGQAYLMFHFRFPYEVNI